MERSDRTRVRRKPRRGRYDSETIHAILDQALVGHVGVVVDSVPHVTPMVIARTGDELLLHGSTRSRLLAASRGRKRGVRRGADGIPVPASVARFNPVSLRRAGESA
jgi:uncharacterized protein